MKECFSYYDCPLISDFLFGTYTYVQHDKGLYYLNLKLMHEEEMVRLLQRKVSWLHITENTLITLTGRKNPQLYSHELLGLIHQRNTIRRIPEQFVPKR